mgnify:CR=1 FL=1
MHLQQQALHIAQTFDVTTPKDKLVLFSISFQNNDTNKQLADNYISSHQGFVTIASTPCGKALEELQLFDKKNELTQDEAYQIWGIASTRMVLYAKGNITAFIKGAHPLSTFCQYELPTILLNQNITTVNGKDKFSLFAEPWF